MGLRPHSSCLEGKMLHWRIRPVQAAFALQFHQRCLHFHDPLWSYLSVPVWQDQLLQKHLLLRAFLLYFHPLPVFQFIYFFPALFFRLFLSSLMCLSLFLLFSQLSPLYCILTLQFLSFQQQTDQFVSPPPPPSLALSLYFPLSSPVLEIEFPLTHLNVSMSK